MDNIQPQNSTNQPAGQSNQQFWQTPANQSTSLDPLTQPTAPIFPPTPAVAQPVDLPTPLPVPPEPPVIPPTPPPPSMNQDRSTTNQPTPPAQDTFAPTATPPSSPAPAAPPEPATPPPVETPTNPEPTPTIDTLSPAAFTRQKRFIEPLPNRQRNY